MILKSDAFSLGNTSVLGCLLSKLETYIHIWNTIIRSPSNIETFRSNTYTNQKYHKPYFSVISAS